MAARFRAEDDGGVYDIAYASHSAQLAGLPSTVIVERFHLDLTRGQEPGQSGLSPPIAPHLPDDPRRNRQGMRALEASDDQGDQAPVVALEGDERTRISVRPGISYFLRLVLAATPSARSAARRSAAVNGPPDSASISSRSTASSSSLAFSSSAAAT